MEAFEHSLGSGCDGFEFDVRQSSDRKLVCVHDEAVRRCDVAFSNYEKLCNNYLKYSRGPRPTEIALLQHVLTQFSDRAFLDIELKVPGMEPEVAELLQGLSPERYVVSSFLPEVIYRMAEIDSRFSLGYISRKLESLKMWTVLPVTYVIPRHDLVSHELIAAVHHAGRKLMTWTVNRPKEMLYLAEWGVDGIISDDPMLLGKTLGRR